MTNIPPGATPVSYSVESYRDKDGVIRHICGRKMSECRQMNGQFWCEIIADRYPDDRRDSMG